MTPSTLKVDQFREALQRNAGRYEIELDQDAIARLSDYYELLLAWNPRLHLVAACSPAEFAMRHVLESLLLLPHLRSNARIADVGSGAGLPIVPALIARPDIHAFLVESSKKKAVFLREALRVTDTHEQATVFAERFESVPTPEVDYVTCRALDRFAEMLPKLLRWSPPRSTLLLFGGDALRRQVEKDGSEFSSIKLPNSERRCLFIIQQIEGDRATGRSKAFRTSGGKPTHGSR